MTPLTEPVPDAELDFDDDGVALYSSSAFTGASYEVTPGGVRSELHYVNGLLQGRATDVALATGVLVGETGYLQGIKHGPQREYFTDGSLREDRDYEYDVCLKVRAFDAQGALLSERVLAVGSAEDRILAQRRRVFGSDQT